MYASISHIEGKDNQMAEAASCLTCLSESEFLQYFCLNFPHPTQCQLLTLMSRYRRQFTSMLNEKEIYKGFSPLAIQNNAISWKHWHILYGWLHIPVNLWVINDPVPFLQIFVECFHQGLLDAKHNPIYTRSSIQYLLSVVHILAAVGSYEPQQKCMGKFTLT